MAGIADVCLCFAVQNRVSWFVNFVAIIASHAAVLMLSTIPVIAFSAFVAGQTLASALFVARNRESAFLEDDIGCSAAFDIGVTLHVLVALAVARLAVGCA